MASKGSYNASAFPVAVFAHLAAVAITALVLVWLLHFREGVAFKSHVPPKIFNMHPLLMVIGFVLLPGEAIMAYKTIPATRKTQKLFHLVFHLIALVAAIVGTYAVFKFHYEMRIADMYTLHSWLGMSTICLFGLQWVFSFFVFWYPGAESMRRARLAPWHVAFGMTILLMGILSAETGLVERFIFLKLFKGQEALIINFTGILILLFAVAVGLVVVLPRTSYD